MLKPDIMLFDFASVLVFIVVGLLFVYGGLWIGALLRPRKYEKNKMRIYECGEPTIGSPWIQYNMRFYTVALVFLVFDVETACLFPVAVALRQFVDQGMGWLALSEIAVFVLILVIGLVYAWCHGCLDWIRSTGTDVTHRETPSVPSTACVSTFGHTTGAGPGSDGHA